MSLDRWLGKDLTNSILTPPNSDDCIPKRQKKSIRVHPRRVNPRKQLYRARRGIRPHYSATAMRQLQFYNYEVATVENAVHVVAGLADHDLLCAGLDGEVLLFDSRHKSYGVVEFDGSSSCRDIAAYGTKLVACTDNAISLIDTADTKIVSSLATDDKIFGFQNIAISNDSAITGTKSGSAYIFDLRTNQISSTIWDAHDPHRRSRPCQQQRGPSLNATEWCGDKTVATASIHNQTVKFWDLRKHSVPVNEVALSQRAPIGGISALKRDSEHKLWVLGRNGALESMLPTQESSIDTYGLVDNPNYATGITLMDDPQLATGMVACGGTNGITVVNRPTLDQAYNYDNSMLSTKWECPGTFSSVYWHQYSKTLVAAGYGTTDCYFWNKTA